MQQKQANARKPNLVAKPFPFLQWPIALAVVLLQLTGEATQCPEWMLVRRDGSSEWQSGSSTAAGGSNPPPQVQFPRPRLGWLEHQVTQPLCSFHVLVLHDIQENLHAASQHALAGV